MITEFDEKPCPSDENDKKASRWLLCFLPVLAGNTKERQESNMHYKGGNGLVFGLLLFSFITFVPLVLFINEDKDTKHFTEYIHISLLVLLIFGDVIYFILFIMLIYSLCKSSKCTLADRGSKDSAKEADCYIKDRPSELKNCISESDKHCTISCIAYHSEDISNKLNERLKSTKHIKDEHFPLLITNTIFALFLGGCATVHMGRGIEQTRYKKDNYGIEICYAIFTCIFVVFQLFFILLYNIAHLQTYCGSRCSNEVIQVFKRLLKTPPSSLCPPRYKLVSLLYPCIAFSNINLVLITFFKEIDHAKDEHTERNPHCQQTFNTSENNISNTPNLFFNESSTLQKHIHEHAWWENLLYTAVVEYALYAIPVLTHILNGKSAADHGTIIQDEKEKDEQKEEYEESDLEIGVQTFSFKKTNFNLRFKLLIIAVIIQWIGYVVGMVFYVEDCADDNSNHINFGVLIGSISMCISIMIFGQCMFKGLRYKVHITYTPDEILLIICAMFFIVFTLFQAVPSWNERDVFQIVVTAFSLLCIIFQTTFIVHLSRADTHRSIAIMFCCYFLSSLNLGIWVFDCLEKTLTCASNLYNEYYGHYYWTVIAHTLFTVGIFYRFHSFMMLFEVASNCYYAIQIPKVQTSALGSK